MLHVMAYNKDRDIYNELALANNYKPIEPNVPAWQEMLKDEKLKDEAGEPYDWLEVWDDKDDNGVNDIIITVEEVVKRKEMMKN